MNSKGVAVFWVSAFISSLTAMVFTIIFMMVYFSNFPLWIIILFFSFEMVFNVSFYYFFVAVRNWKRSSIRDN